MSQYATLTVQPGASRGLAGVLVAAHLAAVAVVWLTLSKWWLLWPLTMVIVVSLADVLAVHALRTARRAVIRVDLGADAAVSVHFRDMLPATGRLLGSSFVSFRLVVLRVALANRHFPLSIVIEVSSLPPEDFRRLRVWLRWRPLHPPASTAMQLGASMRGDNPPTG